MKTDVISENQTSDDSADYNTETGNDESNILNFLTGGREIEGEGTIMICLLQRTMYCF